MVGFAARFQHIILHAHLSKTLNPKLQTLNPILQANGHANGNGAVASDEDGSSSDGAPASGNAQNGSGKGFLMYWRFKL